MRGLLVSIAIGLFLWACVPPGLIDELPGPGLLVEADWLADNLDRSDVMAVHVASSREHYDDGHIPGAPLLLLSDIIASPGNQVNILPDEEVLVDAIEAAGISTGTHVILYGDLGGLAATRAFFTLDVLGHDRLSILNGGREAWQALEYELSTEVASPETGSFNPDMQEHIVVDAEWVEENREDERYFLLDARPPAQYTGEEAGENISRPGHIPGAANLFWQNTLHSAEVRTFRSEDEIAAMLSDAGFSDDQTIVAYCRTGVQASHSYFTARLLGHSVRMYDGSFYDWSNNTEYPVERG